MGPGSFRPGCVLAGVAGGPALLGVPAIDGVAIEPYDPQPSAGATAVLAVVPGANRVRVVGVHDSGRPGGAPLRRATVVVVLAARDAPDALPGTPLGGFAAAGAGRDRAAVLPAALAVAPLGRYELRITVTYRGVTTLVTRAVQGRTYLGGGPSQFR